MHRHAVLDHGSCCQVPSCHWPLGDSPCLEDLSLSVVPAGLTSSLTDSPVTSDLQRRSMSLSSAAEPVNQQSDASSPPCGRWWVARGLRRTLAPRPCAAPSASPWLCQSSVTSSGNCARVYALPMAPITASEGRTMLPAVHPALQP